MVLLGRHAATLRHPLEQRVSVKAEYHGAVPLLCPAVRADRYSVSVEVSGDCFSVQSCAENGRPFADMNLQAQVFQPSVERLHAIRNDVTRYRAIRGGPQFDETVQAFLLNASRSG